MTRTDREMPPLSSLISSFPWAQYQLLGLPTLSQGPSPSLTTFPRPSSCHFSCRSVFLLSENLTSHSFLLAFSFAPNCLVLVLDQRFDTPLNHHSFLAALLKPILQISASSNLFSLSFFSSFSDRQLQAPLPLSSTSSEPFLLSPPTPGSSHSQRL